VTLIQHICSAERAKARRWQEQFGSGECASIEDLAQTPGVDRTYAGQLLRLTSLAPDIIEAILGGRAGGDQPATAAEESASAVG